MLKKGSDYEHFELLARYSARFDLPNKDGVTAAEIMVRKRDPRFRALASSKQSGPARHATHSPSAAVWRSALL